MNKINLLDCTLRDGGYVNDWCFGKEVMQAVFEKLTDAGVEFIEIGFLDERRPFDINRSIQPNTKCYDEIYKGVSKKQSTVFAMIDYGTCNIDNIGLCKDSFIDGIRIIFKKPNAGKAVEFAKHLMDKGYKVCLQMVSITSYSDFDVLEFVNKVNEISPYAVSIVDTYGLLHTRDVMHYFRLLNKNLKEDIILGYHAHNNFQLAYANTIEIAQEKVSRELVLDATIYGMGKSAGNTPLELMVMFMNREFGVRYDINPILEAIDLHILKIYSQKYWGYNLQFYLSASNDCHPQYVQYLLGKKTIRVKDVNQIIGAIPEENKLDYNEKIIEELYVNYQNGVDGSYEDNTDDFFKLLEERDILLLGPGKTVVSHQDNINAYIQEKNPVVIAINFYPQNINCDYIFISNAKRYDLIILEHKQHNSNTKIVVTNNTISNKNIYDYVLSYNKLLDENGYIRENGVVMFLNGLISHNITEVVLAGFDGFSPKGLSSYYSEYLELSDDYEHLLKINANVKERIVKMRERIDISFLTPSLYES